LDEMDNKILTAVIDKFKGGPLESQPLHTAVGEEAGTIEEVYEPFLIQEGYLKRTPRAERQQKSPTNISENYTGRSCRSAQGRIV
jgi:Holliday junction DNA helicase RuvB